MTDREVLEQRLDMIQHDGWRVLLEEYTKLAESLEKIYDIEDEKTLHLRRGQVSFLNMFINLEEATKLALEQLD
ncbi:MAG: hypothetical protein HN922_11505, partial [Anaerolineae bacterium]|jgi:hypothetical protein|nr:hypothetical protein [Anaerolineae bacterium]|tara:strand:+ start:38 stop:259 length:222 start_codon:yes stop_codon:yes gene_type:complete